MSAANKSLQDQLDELDKIIDWFNQDDFDIDEAMQKFNQGVELAETVKERLENMENKIQILKDRFDGAVSEA